MKRLWITALLLVPVLGAAQSGVRLEYPRTRTVDQVDDYFGTKVKDPYRWLEDDTSAETKAWIEAQNAVTFDYLGKIPERKAIEARLTQLWDYERFSLPAQEGPWLVYSRNSGLQNQSVLYRAKGPDAEPEILLDPKNRIFLQDLADPEGAISPFLDAYDADYQVVGNDGELFYVRTDKGAPRYRLVAIDRRHPRPGSWKELLPEHPGQGVVSSVTMIGERFVVVWERDAHDVLEIRGKQGALEREVELPGLGSVAVSGKRRDSSFFYLFTSFVYPTTSYRCDAATGTSRVFRQPKVAFDPPAYETIQVFYPSKDGTRVPMFVTARKAIARDGRNPTYLTGYGGFNASSTPFFSPATIAWLELGGIHALANLRGGGEYGKQWHDAGRLQNKQNVFDDFIAAAEYLVRENYTAPARLAIAGGSNGGLLVGAVLNQRPELFGAALPAVGVMDMLRFHLFTIGWAWKSDYGSAETKDGFFTLIRYSPLQNIRPGTRYPAVLITTADHDDRVVPAHSFKYAATLQPAQAGDAPILIRIETRAGHGAGKPTSRILAETADRYAFLVKALGIELDAAQGPAR